MIRDTAAQLGATRARFDGSSRIGIGILSMVLLWLFGVLFIVAGYSMNIGRGDDSSQIVFLVIAALCFVFGIVAFYFTGLRHRGLYVQTYSDGLARVHGRNTQIVRWDDVTAVWQKIVYRQSYGQTVSTQHIYTVETVDRRRLKFSNEIKDIYGLGQVIQTEVTNRLMPKVMQAYGGGSTVSFGKFSVNKQGITMGRRELEWAEVESASVNNGIVTFKKQGQWGKWASIPVATIPNLPSFLALIDHAVGIKAGR